MYMIEVDNVLLSDDVKEAHFICDLHKCKGACCVEGDLGAPLEESELEKMEGIYPAVKKYLSEAGRKAIEKQGPYILDEEGDYSTTTINGKECAFAVYDSKGILKCGIENAYEDGAIDFRKPISCHLYPIRITKYENYDAVNFDRWEICSPACRLGDVMKVPLYKFLEIPLIRKYGAAWYAKLKEAMKVTKTAS